MPVFRSTYSNLRLTFPAEQFGWGKDGKGNPAQYPPVIFSSGFADVSSDKQVQMMRKHPGFNDLYWEEDPKLTEMVNLSSGEIAVGDKHHPTVSDLEHIAYLDRVSNDKIAANQVKKVVESTNSLIESFNIKGIIAPDENIGIKRLQARVVEVLGLLEDAGVLKK